MDDSVISQTYNPGYFNSNSSIQIFFELSYKLQFSEVDNVLYPLKGYTNSLLLQKSGFGFNGSINQFIIKTTFNKYFAYPYNWYSSVRITGQINLAFSQPYFNQRALGYKDDYLRGDEYFVVDGVAFGLAKLDIKKKL